ncbi:TniB family NTP-binding protein [Motiliproteus sp. MSK22-1]|uniref:TniB family NTP-binding protein n=1 Tax=Motiliproteus sp. MSK22-1 TaxID=1897630 RepID=UPI000975C4E1|nr:TniB family NTP-binding protein [Motiliproteus sp. MSK22-1]OMH39606.1 transposase [Motiliproteus sp. MSK22-1]
MNKDQSEVLSRFNNLVIQHPQFKSALNKIVEAYQLNDEIGFQLNLICIGMSGTGKSTLKRKVVERYPVYYTKDQKIVPVLVIDTPSLPTVKNMAEAMLFQLGDSTFNKGSAVEKTGRILNYIKQCEVKLIIFDELQHFIDQGNRAAPRQVSDWLKTLIDQSGASSVLMGLEQSEHILRINEQLRRRFSRRVNLKPFSMVCSNSFREFIKVLKGLYRTADMPLSGDIDQDLFKRWHFATNGIIAHMTNLIVSAYQIAQREGYKSIHQQCLEQAFTESIWSEGEGKLNPFNRNFGFNRLIKPGMPFHAARTKELDV